MRKPAKALLVAFVSILASIGLTIGAAFSAALAFGAVALIVPGTGTPNANTVENYLNNANNYYLQGTACGNGGCGPSDLTGVNYPASFFPLAIFPTWCRSGPQGCDKWDDSVGQGVNGGELGSGLNSLLHDALNDPNNPGQTVVVFGYSQGGAVVSKTLNEYDWQEGDKQRVQVVTIGGIENPDGGLWQRLAFLNYIPFLDITFAPPMPVDPEIKTTTIGFQYDPVVYAPRYWGNPLAMLNALAAFETVHGNYLEPNGNDGTTPGSLPYGYTPPTDGDPGTLEPQLDCSVHPENCRYDSVGNTYIMIPATSLPMYDLVLNSVPAAFKPFIEPIVKLLTPVTKLFVDLGYDFSGDPGTPTPLSILPFNPFKINPITFPIQVVQALVQGVQDAFGGATALSTPAPAPAPNLLAARTAAPQLAAKLEDSPQTDVVVDKTSELSDKASKSDTTTAEPVVTQTVSDTTDTSDADAAKAAADAAAKAAADKAAADKAAADKAAAEAAAAKEKADKDAADKAAADKAADAAAKEKADKADKDAADKAAADKVKDAADKIRQQAADNAKSAAGGDKSGASEGSQSETEGAATGTAATGAASASDTGKAAA